MNRCLQVYSKDAVVKRYVSETAGDGIHYLLRNIYGPIYLENIKNFQTETDYRGGLRFLEFGCGGGMNLLYLINLLTEHKLPINDGYGTDISEAMLLAARRDAESVLPQSQIKNKVHFILAPNEHVIDDISSGVNKHKSEISNSFHFVFGVNTFRYCIRENKQKECAENLFDLLEKGGRCVMIDMNKHFPLYRSRIRFMLTRSKERFYLPDLDEYASPFENAGFEIVEKRNFCWIPHSSCNLRFRLCRFINPYFDRIAPGFGMRSMVVARKPL